MTKRPSRGKGSYYRSHPLDFELLKRMPREGTQLGFHVLAMTVGHITKELNKLAPNPEAKLTSSQIAARLRSMSVEGLVVNVVLLGREGNGWQRTLKGEKHYQEKTGESLSGSEPELTMIEGGRS